MRSSLFRARSAQVVAVLLACATTPMVASNPAPPSPTIPLQAELIGALDAGRLKEGAPVVAMVVTDWKSGGCHLASGALVHGHVSTIVRRSKATKNSSFQIAFDHAECKGAPADYSFTLIGLIGPLGNSSSNQSGLSEGPPLTDVPALAVGVSNGGSMNAAAGMRSVSSASDINNYGFVVAQRRKLPSHILPGQVIDVPKTDLHVGTGTNGASVISGTNRNVELDPKTTFILVPSAMVKPLQQQTGLLHEVSDSRTPSATHAVTTTSEEPDAPVPTPEPADVTDLCSGDCNHLGSFAARSADTTRPSAVLSLASLGYAPHTKQRSVLLNHETTITYLDAGHLLCTFDPHALRSRTRDGYEPVRKVRAVLIDAQTMKAVRVMDWRVRGDDAYLWRYGQDEVLVHTEHELRLFDSNLANVKTIPIEGPVKWVAASPSTDHIAVGVLKRRYTTDEYRAFDAIGQLPEQDLEVRVYDHNWDLLSVSLRSSGSAEPVLSDGGELRVKRVSAGHWKISEYRWDKTVHDVATVRSICRPLLSAPEPGLTFVTGCMSTTANVWYRMLRSDGHPLLKAESGPDEIVQSAEAAAPGEFAVRVIKAAKAMSVDQPFDRDDVVKEEIGIYRASDGKRISSVVTNDFILAQSSYALSPAGAQMAVVGASTISLYNIGTHP